MSIFYYHLVLRPPLELLPELDEVEKQIKNYKNIVSYCISGEKGKSVGNEKFNHYDLFIGLCKKQREDAIKRSLCDKLEIPKDKRRNCKCYLIDEDKIAYYLGYCVKESRIRRTNIEDKLINEGLEEYNRLGTIIEENWKEDKMNVDDVAKDYEEWLRTNTSRNGRVEHIDIGMCEHYWKIYKNTVKHKLPFSVFQKINKDKLFEYISDPELCGRNERH